jgi:chromosome segregation ATPase
MTIKELFDKAENGTLTYEQFENLAKESKANFTDLAEGKYVSKNKYDSDLSAKTKEIETLNSTIGTRDTDLADLKKQLEDAGTDAEKLANLTNDLSSLQGKYDADVKSYKEQLKKQAYEFAVRDFAGTQKFSSKAAKRDFINSMIAKELKMEKDTILGAMDFVESYKTENADAFVVDTPPLDNITDNNNKKPVFVNTTQGTEVPKDNTGGFANAFHFTPIHSMPSEK